ncbi:MAG: hypothetical protein FWH36_05365 [Lentimicrobiaceae bacterium]|nr:hypothetical protein [Lentimicrobiaceae bacterium]
MEAVLERETRVRPTFNSMQEEGETLTYEILQQRKREQQRLIAAGIIEKPKIVWGFTPEERAEFDRAISIEEYAAQKGRTVGNRQTGAGLLF